jgi:hypothetical protein
LKRLLNPTMAMLIFLALASSLAAQNKNELADIPFSKAPYQIGEQLTYHVTFSNFLDAAHVELLVAERGTFFTRDAIQLRAHVETTGVVNAALYSINNDYTSYIDPATDIPFRTQQIIREGGRISDTSSEYNQPVGTTAIPPKLRLGGFPGDYDLVSAIYRLRALPLAQGASYYFKLRLEREEFEVEMKVTGRELLKTNVGSFNTIVTELHVPANSEANKYRVRIYFSDDERHVPVLLTAKHRAGDIRAELAGSQFMVPAQSSTGTNTTTTVITPTTPQVTVPNNVDQSVGAPLPAELPFKAGEQLNFTISLGNSPQQVATASFQVRPRAKYFNRDGLLLAVKAQTVAAASRIFFANDLINSYVDPNTLLPFRTEMNLVEGRRRINQILSIDQDRGSAVTDKGLSIEIPVGTHDYVSVLYALRSFDLSPSQKTSTPKRNAVAILVEGRPLTLSITSLKRETIQLGGQQLPSILLALTTDDPQPDKYELRLWVSDDRRRLPLRVTARTEIGVVRADLAIIPVTRQ